jgi:hypothetical protein
MTMDCEKARDEALQGDKLEVLYGEADAAARARVSAHLEVCVACRDELAALRGLRRDLGSWRLPLARPAFTPRGLVLPRWLAAAALVVMGLAGTLAVSGYVSLHRALAAQQARADELARQQREAVAALEASLARGPVAEGDATAFLSRAESQLDERLRAAEARQAERLDRRFDEWQARAEVRRRVDMAQVAASLSYLDGRHGEQLARTNELMGYVLQASEKR